MLHTEHGNTEINGSLTEVLSDLTILLKNFKEMLEEEYDEKFAMEQIAECGKLAFMTTEERADLFKRKMDALVEQTGLSEETIMEMLEGDMEKMYEGDEEQEG